MGQDVDTSQGEEMENNIQKDNLKQQILLNEQEEGRIAELNSIGSIKRKQTKHRQSIGSPPATVVFLVIK